jgi:hypothetical protein
MSKHAAEPWTACGSTRKGCQCGMIWSEPLDVCIAVAISERDEDYNCGEGLPYGSEEQKANQLRIVQCVNALAGLNPTALAALILVVEAHIEWFRGQAKSEKMLRPEYILADIMLRRADDLESAILALRQPEQPDPGKAVTR